ncbi:enoyl-CoA hydratase-related protein [Nonomuraea insulae]|uniref:Enoyl-CoA hydratase-related protein n=1 Tax=Nonomuraea insulae TaxID=1616787 RepID=A0ABW1D2S8_9ACTN
MRTRAGRTTRRPAARQCAPPPTGSNRPLTNSRVRWALYPAGGGVDRLSRQIPYTVAADIMLTGRHIDMAEAEQPGLVGHVVPDGKALETAQGIAASIAANGPLAVEAVVRTLRNTAAMSELQAFAVEQPHIAAIFGSDDAKEGPRAFAEKRHRYFTADEQVSSDRFGSRHAPG